MITEELIAQVQSKILPSFVTSITLFESDKFNSEKHVGRLEKFLEQNAAGTLIFRTPAFAHIDKLCPHTVEVPQLPHYQNHLYRYCGVFADVQTVTCVGADEPALLPDLARCVEVANKFNFDFVCALMEYHPRNLVGGRCVFTNVASQRAKVRQMLEELFLSPPSAMLSDWNVDQYFLTDYVKYYPLSIVINAPVGVYKAETQDFLIRRFQTAPTIIVREPNRYDRLF